MGDVHPSGLRSVHVHDFNSNDPRVWYEWNDLAHPLVEHPWIAPDANYFGATILELARLLGPQDASRLRVLIHWWHSVDAILPYTGEDVLVFTLEDGFARRPRYAHDAGLVAKTYGIRRVPDFFLGTSWKDVGPTVLQEVRAQIVRFPSAARSAIRTARRRKRARYVDIPLGTYLLSNVDYVPFESRRYDISFAGSTRNDGEENRRVLPRKTRVRRELLGQLESLALRRSDVSVSLKTFGVFGEARKHEHGYSEQMMQTRLAPCPRGGFKETYRLFEAAASGCVPITDPLPRRPIYEGCPAVVIRSWTELGALTEKLLSDPEALKRRHDASVAWWRERVSPQATARRIVQAMRTR